MVNEPEDFQRSEANDVIGAMCPALAISSLMSLHVCAPHVETRMCAYSIAYEPCETFVLWQCG